MRHAYFGRKLSRTKNERKRLFSGLVDDVLLHGSIRTTLAKAKAVQPAVEKLITLAKKGKTKEVQKQITSRAIEKMLMEDAKTRFAKRTSGFTRIVKLGKRLGDATEEVFLQFVDERVKVEVIKPETKKAAPVKKVEKKVTKKKV